jgi:hypothetical protein
MDDESGRGLGTAESLSDVAGAVEGLRRRGFREQFRVVDGVLEVVTTGERFHATDLVIRTYCRFEGVSDPDDMAIVYGVETQGGRRGALVDAFGVYADPTLSALLDHVPIHETRST